MKYIGYVGMAITFFYSAYLLIRFDFKNIVSGYKSTKSKLSQKFTFVKRFFNESDFRTLSNNVIGLNLGLCFVLYSAIIGIIFHSIWDISFSIYYLLLVLIRLLIMLCEQRISKNENMVSTEKELNRAKVLRLEGLLLIFVSIALVVPVTLLAMLQKEVVFPMWIAIANACYAFYKIIDCTYSFIKNKNNNNLSIKGIKNLNLIGALVSMLTLENAMIMTFSVSIEESMKIMLILSALAVMVINSIIAIMTFIDGNKNVNNIVKNVKN